LNELDEMDIRIIKEALERDLRFHQHLGINPFYQAYYPRLMAKLDRIQKARESEVLSRLEVVRDGD